MRDPKLLVIATLALGCAFLAGEVLGRGAPAEAQQAPPSNYGAGTVAWNGRFIAATGSVGSGMSVLWLVDTQEKRVLVYGTNSLGKDVELRAARNFTWDVKVDGYHDESQFKPEDLKRLAEQQRGEAGETGPKEPPKEPPAPGAK